MRGIFTNRNWYRIVAISFAVISSLQGLLPFLVPNVKAVSLSVIVRPNADGTLGTWAGTGCASNALWDCINDDPDSADDDSTFVFGPNFADGSMYVQLQDMPADFISAKSVEIRARHRGAFTDDLLDVFYQITKADESTALSAESSASRMTTSYVTTSLKPQVQSTSNDKASWDGARLKIRQDHTATALSDNPGRSRVTAVKVTVYYLSSFSKIKQTGYIWENDDEDQTSGDAYDENTQQNGGSTQITAVKKGERLTLRTQIKNTGEGGLNGKPLALFYDHGDNFFTRVKGAAVSSGSAGAGCTSSTTTAFECTTVHFPSANLTHISTAVSPSGAPWISFYENTTDALKVAVYVGSGGTGCTNGSAAWSCSEVDNPALGDAGEYNSIAFDSGGVPWISFHDNATNGGILRVAKYVGSGGSGCTSAAWSCTTVDDPTNGTGLYTSMAIAPNGSPWIAYRENTVNDLRVARYVGSGGSGCTDTAWTCTTVNGADNVIYTAISFDSPGNPWVVYRDTTTGVLGLKLARYVGSGGTGCADSVWTCSSLDDPTNGVGQYPSMAVGPDGNIWVSYQDSTANALKVARYVGSGGTGCADSVWTCVTVDDPAHSVGFATSISFSPDGKPWVAYGNNSTGGVKLARYDSGVGGSGCTDGASGWSCDTVHVPSINLSDISLTFDSDGKPWIASTTGGSNRLIVATLKRSGEITIAASPATNTGDTLSESHADMTLPTDSDNRDDADCIGGGTWNAGKASESEEVELSLPAGNSTPQCTEVAFTIDTSQAVEGRTYRFVVATKDSFREDKGIWRGPIEVNEYAQLTIESATTTRAAKDNMPKLSNCTDTAWGCATIDDPSGGANYETSLKFDREGRPWVTYLENTSDTLKIARFVGSGGSGCVSSSDAWQCTTILDLGSSTTDLYADLAFSPSGQAWVAYKDENTAQVLGLARYVGSGGSGCASSEWTCTVVDDPSSASSTMPTGFDVSIEFDPSGNAWMAYREFDGATHILKVAKYVGSGGTGCTSIEWTCTSLLSDINGILGFSLAFDNSGKAWVSYVSNTSVFLGVAEYVGAGGSGCLNGDWRCTTVDDPVNNVGAASLAIAHDNSPWVSYYVGTANDLYVARYVGSGGSGCTNGSSAWTCSAVDTTPSIGSFGTSIAFDNEGRAWVSYQNGTVSGMKVATHVGSGGSGCDNTAWSCSNVEDFIDNVGQFTAIAVDGSGSPWVSYRDVTNLAVKIARLHLPPTKLVRDSKLYSPGRSARGGDARYKLDWGKSPRGEVGTCSSVSDNKGYCGIASTDSDFDGITAGTNERPMMTFAVRRTTNTANPVFTWVGRSNVAPSSASTAGDLTLQVYNHSTKAWETIATDTTSSNCSTQDCILVGDPSGANANYYEAEGSNHWVYYRVWQTENTSGSETLKTNSTSFGNLPSDLRQRRSDGNNIQTGGLTSDDKTTFSAKMYSPNSSDTLTLNLEIRTVGTAFTGTATHTSSGVSCSGGSCASGVTGTIDITNLASGSYHWQVWVTGTFGTGEKQSFPEFNTNSESAADLVRILTETMMRGGKTFSSEALQEHCVAGYCR